MAPSLAEAVIVAEFGAPPEQLFLEWDPVPVAAASIGQVHKAVLPDGRLVAVKVQYPGIEKAILSDLDNAEFLYSLFSMVALKGLDPKAIVDELRDRMADELDYGLEAQCQTEFADRFRDHPFIHVPDVVPEFSRRRVLTSEWVEGISWTHFEANATEAQRQHAAEVVFRFAQGSVYRDRVFNGDPHPGNYRFHEDGSVTFLDFGLVKRWSHGEWEQLASVLDRVLAHDAEGTVARMEAVGFIAPDHGLDADHVFACVSVAYRAYLVDEYTFDAGYTSDALQSVLDLAGPYGDVIRKLNMPASFVILDRVVWGVSALLGRLHAKNHWRGIVDEYRVAGPPASPLGELEAQWAERRGRAHSSSTDAPPSWTMIEQ
jgi:predicted unusual protein kinase regulating ubiquinone biosynthesis (AarF/ABC1/UbiB family)